jgi:hypothetical protein
VIIVGLALATVALTSGMLLAGCGSPGGGASAASNSFQAIGSFCPTVTVGAPVTFSVVLVKGMTPYTVTWYVDNKVAQVQHASSTRATGQAGSQQVQGEKYNFTFTPTNTTEMLKVHAEQFNSFGYWFNYLGYRSSCKYST